MTNPNEPTTDKQLQEMLAVMQRRLRALTTAVMLLSLAVVLCAAAVYGDVANYFGARGWLAQGGIPAATAALGFAFGWFAGRKA